MEVRETWLGDGSEGVGFIFHGWLMAAQVRKSWFGDGGGCVVLIS